MDQDTGINALKLADSTKSEVELLQECGQGGLNATLDIKFTVAKAGHTEAVMPITPAITQPFGYVHGGATLALLESVASAGARIMADLSKTRVFGTAIDVHHRKSERKGSVRGVARFDHEGPNHGRAGGIEQLWLVTAYNDAGDVMSEGTFTVKVIPIENVPPADD